MFQYQLNHNVFTSKENFKAAVQAVNKKLVTVDEVSALVNDQIIKLYNRLVSQYFEGKPVNPNIVFEREQFKKMVHDLPDNEYAYFAVLVNNGIIGLCGSGYTFERQPITENEISEKAQKAIDKGIQL